MIILKMKDLFLQTQFEEVANQLQLHYENAPIKRFEQLFNAMLKMKPTDNIHKQIEIRAVEEIEEEPRIIDVFDEHNTELFFDVDVTEQNNDEAYSIIGLNYSDYLGCEIEEHTREKFSNAAIIAHSLWELTSFNKRFKTCNHNITIISKIIISIIAPIITFFMYIFINVSISNLLMALIFIFLINIFVIISILWVYKFFSRVGMKVFIKNIIITSLISSCLIVVALYLILWSASQLSQ